LARLTEGHLLADRQAKRVAPDGAQRQAVETAWDMMRGRGWHGAQP